MNPATGGWESTGIVFDSPVAIDDIYDKLAPGRYRLDEYVEGEKGSRNVWGQILEVKMPEPEIPAETVKEKPKRRRSEEAAENPIVVLADVMSMLNVVKEQYKDAYQTLKMLFEGPDIFTVAKKMSEWRKEFDEIAKALGYTRAGSVPQTSPPEYEGKLPIWMHPAAIRGVMGVIREEIRGIAKDLGFVSGSEETTEGGLLELPPKPKVEESEKSEEE